MEEIVEVAEDEKATRLSRLGSALIDMLIMMVFTLPFSYALGLFEYIKSGEQPPPLVTAIVVVLGIAIYFAINGKLLAQKGQTIGKKFNNIKIVTLEGEKPDLLQLMVKRYLPYFGFPYVPFIGTLLNLVNLCWIFGKSSRCLHDYIAGTKVVKA